jgi:hypothetical protein
VEFSLLSAWRDLVRRIAVLTGAGAGLFSLLGDAPPHLAVLRGVAGYFGCLLIGRIGGFAIGVTSSRAASSQPEGERE